MFRLNTWWRILLAGAVTVVVVAWAGWTLALRQRTFDLQKRVLEMEATVRAREQDHSSVNEIQDQRLTQLEQEVFGTLPSILEKQQRRTITREPAWQINRYELLKRRMDAFERWRLQQDGKRQ